MTILITLIALLFGESAQSDVQRRFPDRSPEIHCGCRDVGIRKGN